MKLFDFAGARARVTYGQKFTWLSRGFLAATVIVVLLMSGTADAQSRVDTSISSPAIPAVDPRRAPVIRTPQRARDPFADPLAGPRRTISTRARRSGDGETDPDDPDAADGEPLPVQRRVPLDGDLTPIVRPPVLDGTIAVTEPEGLRDGGDPTLEDGRAAEDIAAFESPPAGGDPAAFSIELSPILDRRPTQLFRFAPFQPIGKRLGTFVLFSELETAVDATNNVFASADKDSDVALEVAPRFRLVSNWRIHAIEFNVSGDASFHREFKTEDDRNYRLEARGRLDIRRRTNIEALISRSVSQESRGSANSLTTAGQDRGDVVTDTAAATLNHRFNRLSLQLRGSVARTNYAPADVNIAVHVPPAAPPPPILVSVDDRDITARDVTLRAAWEFNPELSLFGEASYTNREYAMLQGGVDRDSTGGRWRTGVSFGSTGEYLRGEVSIGWGIQDPEDQTLDSVSGFLFDANLAYRMNALTSFLLTANSDITETTIAGSSAGFTRSAGLSVRHAFRRNVIATAGLNNSNVRYEGISLVENTLTASLGGEVALNRHVVLFGDYDHSWFRTTTDNGDYNVDAVRVGVRLQH